MIIPGILCNGCKMKCVYSDWHSLQRLLYEVWPFSMSTLTDTCFAQRKRHLQTYMDCILEDEEIACCEDVLRFLQVYSSGGHRLCLRMRWLLAVKMCRDFSRYAMAYVQGWGWILLRVCVAIYSGIHRLCLRMRWLLAANMCCRFQRVASLCVREGAD